MLNSQRSTYLGAHTVLSSGHQSFQKEQSACKSTLPAVCDPVFTLSSLSCLILVGLDFQHRIDNQLSPCLEILMRDQQARLRIAAKSWAFAKGCWLLKSLAQMAWATSLVYTRKSGELQRARAEFLLI